VKLDAVLATGARAPVPQAEESMAKQSPRQSAPPFPAVSRALPVSA